MSNESTRIPFNAETSGMTRAQASGHLARKGHTLQGYYLAGESDGWAGELVYTCACGEPGATDGMQDGNDAADTPTLADYQLALNAAVTALLWSEVDGDDVPLDANHDDLSPAARERLGVELWSFITANRADLSGMDAGQIGHDFILTRNHHGVGFWDRGLGARGDRLTDAAHTFSEFSAFVAEDGTVDYE